MDETTDQSIETEHLRGEGPAAEGELEEEEFLRWLTEDERECLQYLLETIKSLEEGLSDETTDDGPSSELNNSENTFDSPDVDEEYESSSNDSRQSRPGESEKAMNTFVLQPNDSKVKLSKSLSAGSTGDPVAAAQESLNKLVNMNPGYLRKFDTIMRSGVNVQELKARFVAQPGASALEDETKATETFKQVLPFPGGSTSPREKALQMLGLLKRNQASLSANSSHEAPSSQAQIPRVAVQMTEGLTHAIIDSGSSSTADSASSSLSSEEIDHQEALRKLHLLNI